nr:3-methyl-2-oxobutanoate hydroxymethyltransferase [Campylobacter sp.]
MSKITIDDLYKMKKNNEKIVMITAYDALFAKIFNDEVDMVLVGDSLNMSFGGHSETIGISVDEMIYHSCAVRRGATRPYLVVDMPFGSTATPELAIKNCIKVYEQTGCDALKIEGGKDFVDTVNLLTKNGIAVMSHIGLRPQFSRFQGGYKISGRSEIDEKILLEDAKSLQDAGAVFLLVEGTISSVAKKITKSVQIPVIGIGAGANCDGQVLMWSDMLGFFDEFKPKFVKRYLDGANLVKNAVKNYVKEVKNNEFPSSEFEYCK